MRVLVRGDQFDGRARFETWLFTIARNLLIDLRRKFGFDSLDYDKFNAIIVMVVGSRVIGAIVSSANCRTVAKKRFSSSESCVRGPCMPLCLVKGESCLRLRSVSNPIATGSSASPGAGPIAVPSSRVRRHVQVHIVVHGRRIESCTIE